MAQTNKQHRSDATTVTTWTAANVVGVDISPKDAVSCRGLQILPPGAGWAPNRPRPEHFRTAQAFENALQHYEQACVAWVQRLTALVQLEDLYSAPGSVQSPPEPLRHQEKGLGQALRYAHLPVERDVAVPNGLPGTKPYTRHYWPDLALRGPFYALLIDVECDGDSHFERATKDRRRNEWMQGRGWYVARLWLDVAGPKWRWAERIGPEIVALQQHHMEAIEAALKAGLPWGMTRGATVQHPSATNRVGGRNTASLHNTRETHHPNAQQIMGDTSISILGSEYKRRVESLLRRYPNPDHRLDWMVCNQIFDAHPRITEQELAQAMRESSPCLHQMGDVEEYIKRTTNKVLRLPQRRAI